MSKSKSKRNISHGYLKRRAKGEKKSLHTLHQRKQIILTNTINMKVGMFVTLLCLNPWTDFDEIGYRDSKGAIGGWSERSHGKKVV